MRNYFLLFLTLFTFTSFAQIDEQRIDGTEQFANAVSVDDNWAVVGNMWQTGHLAGSDYPNAGMISIYKVLPNGNWELFQNIEEPTYFAYDNNPASPIGMYYGCSVDISGDNIIVGAYAYDSDMLGNIGPDGMAFIYSYDEESDLFLKVATLAPEIRVENEFGRSVAISGNWAVVGDPLEEHPLAGGGDDRESIGCAHVYRWETGTWVHKEKLTASDGWGGPFGGAHEPGDFFGYSVDTDGDVIAVGAPGYGEELGTPSGAAYVYAWDGINWNETILEPMMAEENARFGTSVSILNDYLAVGAPGVDGGGLEGSISIFEKNVVWGDAASHWASDSEAGNLFGHSVSLSSEYLAVGAYGFTSETGKLYLYDYTNAMDETSLQASDIAMGDEFAYSCGISNDHLIVGAHKTERNAGDPHREGTAYFYSMALAFGGQWTGAEDTDWGNPGNWADNNVPNGVTDVLIPSAPVHQPFIDKMVANCKNLTIQAGASLTLGPWGEIVINGDLANAGQILEGAKSDRAEPSLTVLGETLFNGAGRQDIPSGVYQAFTFQAQEDSYLTGDVTFNGNYDHDTFDDLEVGANTLTVGGFLWGNDRYIIFSAQSSLTIINDRVIDLSLASNIYDLYDFTINVPGNHHVVMEGSIEVHNQLNLLDGDLYIGDGALGGTLELHNPINIINGRLLPHKWGGESKLEIHDAAKNKDVFHIPSTLSTLDMLYISRSGATLLDGDLHIESLFLLSSAGFNANGHQITYGEDGEIWIDGDANISADMITGPNGIEELIISSGSPTLDFDGEIQGDFQIDAAVGQVEIAAGRCISVSGTTILNAPLLLRSDATGTACFIDHGPIIYSAKDNASISVERYIPSKDEWHYVSSPVQNSTAQFFSGSYLNAYDTDNSTWVPFTNLNQAVNTMQGYSSKVPAASSEQTYTFSGQLNTARTSPLSIDLTDGGDGYNLVGNPFPSVIDWDHANWTKTDIADAVYTWNASTGSYASYVDGAAVNGGSQYIAPMQGFFVEATGVNPSLQIDDNDVRVDEAASFLKSDDEFLNQLSINLEGTTGTDEIMIRFIEEASSAFDGQYDAHKMFGKAELAQVFAIDNEDNPMAIHSLSTVKETEFVKLGLRISKTGNHTLLFDDQESFIENVTITLEDKKTQIFRVLNAQDQYEFNYEEGENADRFILHFKDVTSVSEINDLELFAYTIGHSIYVNIEEDMEAIQVYNLGGQIIYEMNNPQEGTHKLDLPELTKGVYFLKLKKKHASRTQKIIIH